MRPCIALAFAVGRSHTRPMRLAVRSGSSISTLKMLPTADRGELRKEMQIQAKRTARSTSIPTKSSALACKCVHTTMRSLDS